MIEACWARLKTTMVMNYCSNIVEELGGWLKIRKVKQNPNFCGAFCRFPHQTIVHIRL